MPLDPCLFVRCLGKDCLEGTQLAEGEARQLAVGSTRLYAFDFDGTLFEAPLAGGEFTSVFETGLFISAVRANGDRVVWATNFGADLYEPETKPAVRTLTDDAITFGFAMDDQAIYYGMQNNAIVRVTLADAMSVAWAATQATALGLAIAGDDLYFTNCESVFRARNELLGAQDPIARGGCSIEIVSSARAVAWSAVESDAFAVIRRYDIASETVVDLVETLPQEKVLHVDDTHVYYGGGGALCRVPIDGGVPAKVVLGNSFAFDATGIYWNFDRKVFRVAKPPD